MLTKIIEATNGFNWGKFMLGQHDQEWHHTSSISHTGRPLLSEVGWDPDHLWVLDLQTGEGALFRMSPHGHAQHDLKKHRIWVCPLFEPFLGWLYGQDLTDVSTLPETVQLPGVESAFYGYRRTGK